MRNYLRYTFSMLMVCFIAACRQEEPKEIEPIEVVVAPVEQRSVPIYGRYIATMLPSLDVEVRARVSGFLGEMSFNEGSLVQEGDVLYRIDDRPYQANLERVRAQLQRSEAALAKAQRDVARLRPLYEQDAASQLDFDNAIAAQEQAEADVAESQANLVDAELKLEYTEVRAPISGLIGASNVDIGALVGSEGESLLCTIKRIDPMFVEFHMSDLDYLNARRSKQTYLERRKAETSGKSVEGFVNITLPDKTDYNYLGDISFTDPQVNSDTGTFTVRAVVPNPDRVLLPGQYTRVRLRLDTIPNALLVDEKAIQIEQGGSFAMVAMSDNTVERRFLVVGTRFDGSVVVDSGLEAGELIIVEGMHKVDHGDLIVPLTVEAFQARLRAEEAAMDELESNESE
ncbi:MULTISPECIES: efflux RND transporter periplasmic adaptor subunit [unclassified Lentimonas]|uniref:efflux RND transporter periplasmic adaptor subunit n=1 Tax=unclassified Lentimonas TaxID=2630993 RepID=UPI001FD0D16E|nr:MULTISPECIES: efflux RND transporter periplasmic adaptor subunit [unclassified Lentimonas]